MKNTQLHDIQSQDMTVFQNDAARHKTLMNQQYLVSYNNIISANKDKHLKYLIVTLQQRICNACT